MVVNPPPLVAFLEPSADFTVWTWLWIRFQLATIGARLFQLTFHVAVISGILSHTIFFGFESCPRMDYPHVFGHRLRGAPLHLAEEFRIERQLQDRGGLRLAGKLAIVCFV